MEDIELKHQLFELFVTPVGTYKPHKKQELFHRAASTYRNVYWLAGRQVGKSLSAAVEAAYALLVPHSDGDVHEILVVSDKLKYAATIFEKVEAILLKTPDLEKRVEKINHSNSKMEIVMKSGARLRCRSSHNPNTLAGDTASLLITDESGFVSDRALSLVRPTLAVREGRHIAIGTADVRSNWFRDYWKTFKDEGEHYEAGGEPRNTSIGIQAASTDSPYFTAEELEVIKKTETQRNVRVLYLAEFVSDEDRLIPESVVQNVSTLPIPELNRGGEVPLPHQSQIDGKRFVAGVDIARYQDYTVVVVLDVSSVPAKLVNIRRWQHKTPEVTAKTVASILSAYQATGYVDSTGVGDVYFDMIRKLYNGVRPFVFTSTSKNPLIESMMVKLEQEDVHIYPDENLLEELAAFTARPTSVGGIRYEAKPPAHDDCVISLALALQGVRNIYEMNSPRIRSLA